MPEFATKGHCPGDSRRLVLASGSPRRQELLRGLGLRFEIDASNVSEDFDPRRNISDIVLDLALSKAREVASRHRDALIVAADTLVTSGPRIFGKPRDAADAREMLLTLSGTCHRVFTGLVLLDGATRAVDTHVEETEVCFRPLSEAEIQRYIQTPEPFDKAGAYGAQGLGSVFIERIVGDYFNVVGLPLAALNELLRRVGACVLCRRANDSATVAPTTE